MKKLFIFDMGGVVCLNVDVMPEVLKTLKISREVFLEFAGPLMDDLSNGVVRTKDFWTVFSSRSGIPVGEDLFSVYFKPVRDEKMIVFIRHLEQHSRVVCGTNTYDGHYSIHSDRGDYDVFHRTYASNHMGISKPDPAFWTHILSEEKTFPSEAVFIDDRDENIEAARKCGIDSFLFTTPEKLTEDFRRAGLLNGQHPW